MQEFESSRSMDKGANEIHVAQVTTSFSHPAITEDSSPPRYSFPADHLLASCLRIMPSRRERTTRFSSGVEEGDGLELKLEVVVGAALIFAEQ